VVTVLLLALPASQSPGAGTGQLLLLAVLLLVLPGVQRFLRALAGRLLADTLVLVLWE
jgi:hypothetical protein